MMSYWTGFTAIDREVKLRFAQRIAQLVNELKEMDALLQQIKDGESDCYECPQSSCLLAAVSSARLRLSLLHKGDRRPSVSLKQQGQLLFNIPEEKIPRDVVGWTCFELEQEFEAGRHRLELVIERYAKYYLRDIFVEFLPVLGS